ncbi:MAG: hypothetical protein M1504_00340 [Candidatus Marsarchaeota archaeon]|nr:hypothetical protein [Candidatus Marsarchaeota archaeon]
MTTIIKIGGSLAYTKDDAVDVSLMSRLIPLFRRDIGDDVAFVIGCGKKLHGITDRYYLNEEGGNLGTRIHGFFEIRKDMEERLGKIEKVASIGMVDIAELIVKETRGNKLSPEIAWLNRELLDTAKPFITSGGAVLDRAISVCTVSSDTVAAYLAVEMNAQRLVIVTDTNGILDADGRTIPVFNARDFDKFDFINRGMRDKVRRVRLAVKAGIKTYVANGREAVSVDEMLADEKCTRLVYGEES